jgi:hypothetical protein
MASLTARVHLVDGGLMVIPLDDNFLVRLTRLQAAGLQGKALVHELLTDDWGPPPVAIVVKGTAPDGSSVDFTIPYD